VRVTAFGFETEDFDVSLSGNNLLIEVERKESENGKNGPQQASDPTGCSVEGFGRTVGLSCPLKNGG
jgi:HSP20 family molecular chaperone IbpA